MLGQRDQNDFMSTAIQEGNIEKVEQLLQNGHDLNAELKSGLTPLIMAAVEGKREIYNLLVTKGADPKKENKNGFTAENFFQLTNELCKLETIKELDENTTSFNSEIEALKDSAHKIFKQGLTETLNTIACKKELPAIQINRLSVEVEDFVQKFNSKGRSFSEQTIVTSIVLGREGANNKAKYGRSERTESIIMPELSSM